MNWGNFNLENTAEGEPASGRHETPSAVSTSSLQPSAHNSDIFGCETLERLGELRPDRINNPKYARTAIWIYAPILGLLGVLSGFTLYFKIEPIVHGVTRSSAALFELLIAAAMVAILEWVKGVIQYGTKDLLPSRRTLMMSIFTVVLFEIIVLAAHNIPALQPAELQREIGDIWQGTLIDFAMLVAFWMIVGAVLAGWISGLVFGRTKTVGNQAWFGALRGVLAGPVAAGMVLGAVIVVRAIWVVELIAKEHPRWHSLLDKSPRVFVAARALDYLLDSANQVRLFGISVPFGFIIIVALAIFLVYWSWKSQSWKPLGWFSTATLAILFPPVADVSLLRLLIQVFIAWSVPGALLGATVFWLKPTTRLPGSCAAGALLAGLLLASLGIYYFARPWAGLLLIPTAALMAASIYIIMKKEIQAYWPLAAVSIAVVTCLVTIPIAWGRANLSGTLETLNGLTPQGSFSKLILGNAIAPVDQAPSAKPAKNIEPADAILSQLCITGSLSFWVSVGLLIGWSIRETHERVSVHSDGKNRCFWAKEGSNPLVQYHDLQHGVFPKDDRDLFTRFSLELLRNGSPWMDVRAYTQVFEGFVPEKVAQMNATEARKQVQKAKLLKYSALAFGHRVESVIENAKHLQTFYAKQAGITLIRALQLEAARGAEPAVRFFRSTFRVRRDFAVGSFLQATGFLPGAHFRGCWVYVAASNRRERPE